jgi:PAS domain S-box-containing protein
VQISWPMIPYLVPYLISAAISGGIGAYAWYRRAVAGAWAFAVVALAEALWTLGYACELASGRLEAKVFWDNVQWIGAFAWSMAFWALALQYTGRRWPRRRRTWRLLAIVPAVFLLLVFTNRFHEWVRPGAWLVPGEPFAELVYDFTAVQVFAALYAYALVLYGLWLLVDYAIRSPRFYRAQVALIGLGTLVPLVGTVLTLAGVTFTVHRDTTPFTFAASNLIIAWGLFRYRLFDIAPVARDAVVESMVDAVIVLDARNRVVGLNPAAQELIDRPTLEAIGRPADEVLSAWPDLVTHYRDVAQARTEIAGHVRGKRRSLDLRISPLYDWRHRHTGRLIVVRDITERKRAESQRDAMLEALHKERDLIAAVLDTAGALVVVLDPQGRIERFNRACEQLTGYSFDQAKGKYLWDFLLPPEEVETVRAVWEELKAGHYPSAHESHWVGQDGSRRLIAWSDTVLLDDRGEVEYIVGTGIDVEEERRREREARALAEIAKLAGGTLRLEDVLERAAEYARELFEADHCGIALYDEAQGTLRYVVIKGELPELAVDLTGIEIRPTDAFRERVLEGLQPVVVEDALSSPVVGPQLAEFVRLLEIQSFVVAPMEAGGRPLGFVALTMCHGRQRRFTSEDAELALVIAKQAAIAIDNAQLYEAQQRRAEQFQLISEVGQRITSILEVDDLLTEIACLVKETLGCHLVGIALVEGDELVFKAGAGGAWEVSEFRPPRLRIGQEGITGWVAGHGEPLLVPDVGKEPRYYAVPQAAGVRSELAVPLKAQDAIVGVMHAQSDRLDAFDEGDLDVLQSLAHQAAIAIENARSYASARRELAARKEAEAALRRVNEELERRVEERTAELVAANASLRAEVAGRVRAEQTLQESETRYRMLFQSANDAILVMDGDRFLECNRASEAMFGCSRDDIIGRSPDQFSPARQPDGSDSREKARGKIDAALDGTPQFFEWLHRRVDGTLFDVEVSLNRMALGDEWLLLAIVRDITERKRAEEALRLYTGRIEVLHEIDRGVLAARSVEEIAQVAVSRVRQLVPCQRASITLFDLARDEAIILAVSADVETMAKKGVRFPLDRFEDLAEAARRGQVIMWEDLRLRGTMVDIVWAEGVRSYATVPLVARGQLIGALNLGMSHPGVLTAEHVDVARQVADQLAIAIHQARLYEQVQHHAGELERRVSDRTRELSVLYEVAALASQSLDLETTLARSLEQILEAVSSDAGAIHLLDDADSTSETLRLVVQQGLPPDLLAGIESTPSGEGLQRWAPDMISDPRLSSALPTAEPLTDVDMPLRAGGRTLGVLSIVRRTDEPQLNLEELSLLTSVADQLGSVVESARLRQQAERAAVLEERGRLARDLHDSVTQLLYSVNLFARSGQNALDARDLDKLGDSLARLGESAQQALKEMRLLVYELRPLALEREGLADALRQRLDAVEGRVGVVAQLSADETISLPKQVEGELYRIGIEALNNALKHAKATSVTVRLSARPEGIQLEVTDDGRGFDPGVIEGKGGLGLVGMRERAERMGGVLAVTSAPGKGTEIKVTVPYTSLGGLP